MRPTALPSSPSDLPNGLGGMRAKRARQNRNEESLGVDRRDRSKRFTPEPPEPETEKKMMRVWKGRTVVRVTIQRINTSETRIRQGGRQGAVRQARPAGRLGSVSIKLCFLK